MFWKGDAAHSAGYMLRRLQRGEVLSLPQPRPMPAIGGRCYELRIVEERVSWRIVYRVDADAILILAVFRKQTQQTPGEVIEACRRRIQDYDS